MESKKNNECVQLHSISEEQKIFLNTNIYDEMSFIVGAVLDSLELWASTKNPFVNFQILNKPYFTWMHHKVLTMMLFYCLPLFLYQNKKAFLHISTRY